MKHSNLFDLAAIISQLGTLSGAPNALAGSGDLFQNLSQRQQDFESKASAEQKLQGLIGTAAVPGMPFDINNSPLMPVEPVPGTGFAGQAGLESQQVEMLKNLAGVAPQTAIKTISDQLFKSGGQEGFTLSPGQTRFDAQGNVIAGGGNDPKANQEKFSNLIKVRNNFERRTNVFAKQDDAFGRIRASAQDPSAAGDLALIFNYMKLLDPGSTVREGEFATAQNAGGVEDRTRALFGRLLQGTRLTPKQRRDFVGRSEKLYTTAFSSNEKRRDQSRKFAESQGLDPEQATFERANQIEERRETEFQGKKIRAYRIGNKWYTY